MRRCEPEWLHLLAINFDYYCIIACENMWVQYLLCGLTSFFVCMYVKIISVTMQAGRLEDDPDHLGFAQL